MAGGSVAARQWLLRTAALVAVLLAVLFGFGALWARHADDGLVPVGGTILSVEEHTVGFTDVVGETHQIVIDPLPEDSDVGDTLSLVYPSAQPAGARQASDLWLVMVVLSATMLSLAVGALVSAQRVGPSTG